MTNHPLTSHTFERLLEQAQQIAQTEAQPFDTLHILLAALSPADGRAFALDLSIDTHTLNRLIGYIKVELRLLSSSKDISDGKTGELNQSSAFWTQRAEEYHLILNDALILQTILSKDARARQILSIWLDVDHIIKVLETLLEQEKRQVFLPVESDEEFHRFYGLISYQQAEVVIDRDMHDVEMNNFLNILGAVATQGSEDFVVVSGQHGSPLKDLANVLAYRLEHEHFIGVRTPLNSYKKVYDVNIDKLRLLATQPGYDVGSPGKIFKRIKRQAVAEHAIIILTHFQKMSNKKKSDPIGEAIKFELADPGDAVIAGFFEYEQNRPSNIEVTLNLSNARIVGIDSYDREKTLLFLNQYYFPRWKSEGYTFAEDAFDSIITLEPGAWIDKRRKTLPYLAAGLGNDTILTTSGGKKHIKDVADCAWTCLNKLLTLEQPKADPSLLLQFDETLKQAEQDILWLRQHFTLEKVNNTESLTRAHVITQLICHNDSEFHYPGFAPTKYPEPRIRTRTTRRG